MDFIKGVTIVSTALAIMAVCGSAFTLQKDINPVSIIVPVLGGLIIFWILAGLDLFFLGGD